MTDMMISITSQFPCPHFTSEITEVQRGYRANNIPKDLLKECCDPFQRAFLRFAHFGYFLLPSVPKCHTVLASYLTTGMSQHHSGPQMHSCIKAYNLMH